MNDYPISKKLPRIEFIDLMRAYAILMMVQGHLTGALLDPIFRDSSNSIYYIWNFMRGITAPVFFFASGTIFSLLLLSAEENGLGVNNPRVKKGFKRTLMLLGIGYLLQIGPSFFKFLTTWNFEYLNYFMISHVLHIIGISIFMIIAFYIIARKLKIHLFWTFFIIGNLIFILYPSILNVDWNSVPRPLANYFTNEFGSAFTILPWSGFSILGAGLGFLIHRRRDLVKSNWLFVIIFILGLSLHHLSGDFLITMYKITTWDNFLYLYNNNFLHYRLGQVFFIVSIFGIICKYVKIPKIITIIGSETLPIYVAHSIVIYGTFTGFGLAQIYGKTLNGWQCLGLALIVEAAMITVAYYGKTYRKYFSMTISKVKGKFHKS